jgi:hypothetical protein
LPGAQKIVPRETSDRSKVQALVEQVAPGFTTSKIGKRPMAIVAEHAAREGVLRTWPVGRHEPCLLRRAVEVPRQKHTRLVLNVSHEPKGAWTLTVRVDGRPWHQARIEGRGDGAEWQTISLDLTPLAGRKVNVDLIHASVDERPDAAYWSGVEIISQ